MKAFIYYNLNNGCWSVKSREPETYGKVVAHVYELVVAHVEFKVSEAGRQRVIEEQRKNVHAGVSGRIVAWRGADPRYPIQQSIGAAGQCSKVLDSMIEVDLPLVSYNPYYAGYFYTKEDKAPVYVANLVGMYGDRSVRMRERI